MRHCTRGIGLFAGVRVFTRHTIQFGQVHKESDDICSKASCPIPVCMGFSPVSARIRVRTFLLRGTLSPPPHHLRLSPLTARRHQSTIPRLSRSLSLCSTDSPSCADFIPYWIGWRCADKDSQLHARYYAAWQVTTLRAVAFSRNTFSWTSPRLATRWHYVLLS